jgi:hypothetical protein
MGMEKPILIDLFCRMGGATVGYRRAGFHVIGVDIEPQPGYPGDEFYEMDALKLLELMTHTGGRMFDLDKSFTPALIHASPPCQDGNTATMTNRKRGIIDSHVQLVPPTRALLDQIGIPYVIEQPTSSRKGTIRRDLTLCMDMFKGDLEPPWVMKHRSFELGCWPESAMVTQPVHRKHAGRVRGWRHGEYFDGPYVAAYGKGGGKGTTEEIAHAMQIDWMTDRFDLCEAIPPAYSEHIGEAFLRGQGGHERLGYR